MSWQQFSHSHPHIPGREYARFGSEKENLINEEEYSSHSSVIPDIEIFDTRIGHTQALITFLLSALSNSKNW